MAVLVLVVAGALLVPRAWADAQGMAPSQAAGSDLVGQLRNATNGTAQVSASRATGLARFLTTDPHSPVPKPNGTSSVAEPAARSFLGTYGSLFGVPDQSTMKMLSQRAGPNGQRSVKFGQTHNGVPLVGGELVVGLDAKGDVLSANGEVVDVSTVDTNPTVTAGAASSTARQAVAKAQRVALGTVAPATASLAIYDSRILGGPGRPGPRLVWQTGAVSRTGAFDELVFVDARTGAVVLHFDKHAEAKNRKVCDRNNVVGGAELCTSGPVRVEGGAASSITDVNQAYDFAGETYDFYFNKFGRDSLDAAGLPLVSTTRFCPSAPECPFENAFWNGTQMVYGDGFTVDDVVGHELTHGVTDHESRLFYFAQSGAINESLSDVFGEFIDLSNTAGGGDDSAGARWKIGEDIGAIRDMKNPPAFNNADRMGSTLYFSGDADNAGVHENSGVNNKAAFLLTDGATFNGKTVTGLGIDKVARIYYEANVHLLTSASDYNDLYDILQQSCKNLIGSSGIVAADCVEVKDAVDATQMNTQPTGAAIPEAPLCPAGQVPTNLFFDNLENTASGNWTKSTAAGTSAWQYPVSGDTENATSGKQNFWGADASNAVSDFRIARSANVAVPAGTTFLRFSHMFDLEFDFDGGVVEYSTNNGTTYNDAGPLFDSNGYNDASLTGTSALAGRPTFTGFTSGYLSSRINLSSLAGQNVRFRFRIGTDDTVGFQGWFIDDIRVYQCAAGSSAPTASAGPDATVASGTAFHLTGTGTDPEGKPLAYLWVQIGGPAATIRDPRERVAEVNGVNGGSTGQDLQFRVTVTDSQGLTSTDTVNVHINPK